MEMTDKLKINRDIFDDENLNYSAKWLYIVLCNLEIDLSDETDCFFRSQENLVEDTGMHQATIKRHRKQLVDGGWIKFWLGHRISFESNRKHPIMFYQILK